MKIGVLNLRLSKKAAVLLGILVASLLPGVVLAATIGVGGGTGGTEFQPFYNFVYSAGTGYLGRSIAIVGGLIGLGIGAATGKGIPALIGVFLAVFGVLGPTIVNAMFTSALI